MLLEIIKTEKVALDGTTVVLYKKGDQIELEQKLATRLIGFEVAQEVKKEEPKEGKKKALKKLKNKAITNLDK